MRLTIQTFFVFIQTNIVELSRTDRLKLKINLLEELIGVTSVLLIRLLDLCDCCAVLVLSIFNFRLRRLHLLGCFRLRRLHLLGCVRLCRRRRCGRLVFHHFLDVVLLVQRVVLHHANAAHGLDDLDDDGQLGVRQVHLVFGIQGRHETWKASKDKGSLEFKEKNVPTSLGYTKILGQVFALQYSQIPSTT